MFQDRIGNAKLNHFYCHIKSPAVTDLQAVFPSLLSSLRARTIYANSLGEFSSHFVNIDTVSIV